MKPGLSRVELVCFVLSCLTAYIVTALLWRWLGPPDAMDAKLTLFGVVLVSFLAYWQLWAYWSVRRGRRDSGRSQPLAGAGHVVAPQEQTSRAAAPDGSQHAAVREETVKLVPVYDGKRRIEIFRRTDGFFGLREWYWYRSVHEGELIAEGWASHFIPSGIYLSAEDAERDMPFRYPGYFAGD